MCTYLASSVYLDWFINVSLYDTVVSLHSGSACEIIAEGFLVRILHLSQQNLSMMKKRESTT